MSFGRELQLEREKRGVLLASIAEHSRVPERFLSALEQNEFEQMPGGVFNKGILRSYCRDLGLDESLWLQRFEAAAPHHVPPDLAEFMENVQRNRTQIRPGRAVRWWGALLMLLALCALGWAAWKYVVQPRVLGPALPSVTALRNSGSLAG